MKVRINRDRDGWHYYSEDLQSGAFATYPQAVRSAKEAGHEIDNAGWIHRLLMWNFNMHAIDGYPEWEIERERSPAFAKLTHERTDGSVESHDLASAWDGLAEVDFYQRDWTDDGIPFVRSGEIYWSGWWFATVAERDRFVEWHRNMFPPSPPNTRQQEHRAGKIGGSRRRGRRASWLSYAAVLIHRDNTAKLERLLLDAATALIPDPERKARAWARVRSAIAARRMHS